MSMMGNLIEDLNYLSDSIQNGYILSPEWYEIPKRASETIRILSEKLRCSEKENKWIPCSEQMPSDGTYLVTMDPEMCGYEEAFVGMCTVTNCEWDEWGVYAWMPLPEPYKEDGERE